MHAKIEVTLEEVKALTERATGSVLGQPIAPIYLQLPIAKIAECRTEDIPRMLAGMTRTLARASEIILGERKSAIELEGLDHIGEE